MEENTRAAVYARVSTDEQREAKSIEVQVDFARDYSRLYKTEVVDHYKDDGVSGTMPLSKRPAGRRLLKDAEAGRFDVVLIYSIDRLARTTLHLLQAHEQLEKLGIGLRSMTQPFETSTSAGKFIMGQFGLMAAFERDNMLERNMRGRLLKARQGKWAWGGKPPLGYELDDDTRAVMEPGAAEMVRLIFRRYTENGLSMVQIADELNGRNMPPPGGEGGKWTATAVRRVLSQTAYKGFYVYQPKTGDEITVEVPSIVTDETWAKAEALREGNRKAAKRNVKRQYLLRGLIRCELCGLAYAGDGSTRRQYSYYRCTGVSNANRALGQPCIGKAVKAEELDEVVWQDVKSFVENPGPIITRLQVKLEEEREARPDPSVELAELEKAIANKKGERQRATNLHVRGTIDEEEARTLLDTLRNEIAALEKRRVALIGEQFEQQDISTQLAMARTLLEQLQDKVADPTWDTKRELVLALVEWVKVKTVGEGKAKTAEVTIRYRFQRDEDADCVSSRLRRDSIAPPGTLPVTTN